MEEEKKDNPGYFSRLAKSYINARAEQNHPVFTALQDQYYPEDAKARIDKKAQAQRMTDLQEQGLRLSNQQKEQDIKNNETVFERNKARADYEKELFMQQRRQLWDENGRVEADKFKNALKEQSGYDFWNVYGQAIFDNSENLGSLTEAMQVMQAYERSDEEGDYMLSQTGWKRMTDENGNTKLISPEGDLEFNASDDGIRKVMTEIQKKLLDDMAAAYIMGGDSTDLQQFATKNILSQNNTEKVFGTYGNAIREYNQFINKGVPNAKGGVSEKFNKTEKLGHILSRSLQSAIIDGKISQEEMAQLTPLFALTVKKMGGEVIFGNDVANTKVKLGSGMEVPLTRFAQDLAERDVVMHEWNNHVNNRYAEMLKVERKAKNNTLGGDSEESAGITQGDHDLFNMYRFNYSDLSNDEQTKLKSAKTRNNMVLNTVLKEKQAKTLNELSLEDLRNLDNDWNNKVDNEGLNEKKFYSPYQDEIFKREIALLNEEKAPLIAELRELEKTTSEYQEHLHGRRGPDKKQKQLIKLKKKIDKINDSIKMQKNKLESRGIKIEDNK